MTIRELGAGSLRPGDGHEVATVGHEVARVMVLEFAQHMHHFVLDKQLNHVRIAREVDARRGNCAPSPRLAKRNGRGQVEHNLIEIPTEQTARFQLAPPHTVFERRGERLCTGWGGYIPAAEQEKRGKNKSSHALTLRPETGHRNHESRSSVELPYHQ